MDQLPSHLFGRQRPKLLGANTPAFGDMKYAAQKGERRGIQQAEKAGLHGLDQLNNKKHRFKIPVLLLIVVGGTSLSLSVVAAAHSSREASITFNHQITPMKPERLSLSAATVGAQDPLQPLTQDLSQPDQARIAGNRARPTLEARRARHHQHLRFIRELRKAKGKKPNV